MSHGKPVEAVVGDQGSLEEPRTGYPGLYCVQSGFLWLLLGLGTQSVTSGVHESNLRFWCLHFFSFPVGDLGLSSS